MAELVKILYVPPSLGDPCCGNIEVYRRVFAWLVRSIADRFCITATFDEKDPMYSWLLYWLSRRPIWRQARDVEVTTRHYGLETERSMHPWLPPKEDLKDTSKAMSYLPREGKTYHMWYKRRLMLVSRRLKMGASFYQQPEILKIRIFAFDQRILGELLEDARTEFKAAKENVVSVWASNNMNNWINITSNPKRSIRSVILDPGVKESLLEDAREFLVSQPWYTARGIPFRRGYLLHGAPGSGKTSTIQSIAGELGLDVYIITLSRGGLDDNALYELIGGLPNQCIALMEDIDTAFKQGITREVPLPSAPLAPKDEATENSSPSHAPLPFPSLDIGSRSVTLSGLLNALDGIGAQEGRILFATTNNFDALDPALIRPGRMDVHVEFRLASKLQAEQLFKCFYDPSTSIHSTSPPRPSPQSYTTHESSPGDEKTGLEDLAARFATFVPDRKLSMASLQGYLMRHKEQPRGAVQNAPDWVEAELRIGPKDDAEKLKLSGHSISLMAGE